jgi:hypothetical protein
LREAQLHLHRRCNIICTAGATSFAPQGATSFAPQVQHHLRRKAQPHCPAKAPKAFTLGARQDTSVAAAGENDDGNDDQPDAVVVKEIAEAVVHNRSSLKG